MIPDDEARGHAGRDAVLGRPRGRGFDATGKVSFNRTIQGGIGRAVDVDPSGVIALVGNFSDKMDLGGGVALAAPSSDFVARLDANGAALWARAIAPQPAKLGLHGTVVFDAAGNVLVATQFHGTSTLGSLTSAGGADVLVAKLDPSGSLLWAKRFGGSGDDLADGVAVDPAGDVLVVGGFAGSIDFGGGPLVSAGGRDAFLAKLDPSGNHLWSLRFGGPDHNNGDELGSVLVEPSGAVVVGGAVESAVDFGGGPVDFQAGDDLVGVVASFDSMGNHLWSESLGHRYSVISALHEDAVGHVATILYSEECFPQNVQSIVRMDPVGGALLCTSMWEPNEAPNDGRVWLGGGPSGDLFVAGVVRALPFLAVMSAMAFTRGSCWGESVPPVPQGAYQVNFGEPAGCNISGRASKVGDVTSTQRNEVVIDGLDGSSVGCLVSGNGPFSVTGRIQKGGDSLQITVPSLAASATRAAPSKGQVDYVWATTGKSSIADASHPCDFYFVSGSKEAVAPGKVWLAFTCDAISTDGDTCSLLESYVILEDCAQ